MVSVRSVSAAALAAGDERFDAVIDARSPAEFADDHLPGACNWPVLDDAERAQVGTLYAQAGALAARQVGAPLAARRIAQHLERKLRGKPADWRPLVYCWRGGQRSGTLAWFLAQIGFRSAQLAGGYKAWRALVRSELDTLPVGRDWRVLCGRTGSGKTRLLQALAAQGAQVLDLEGLACHRGSVLGALPDAPQPSQKRFEHLLWQALRGFDRTRAVWVESESGRIGALRVPAVLLDELRQRGRCLQLALPFDARIALLLEDYAHFQRDPEGFNRQLDPLIALRGRDTIGGWQSLAKSGDWPTLFGALIREHYDPLYERSLRSHFPQLAQAATLALPDAGAATLQAAAAELLRSG